MAGADTHWHFGETIKRSLAYLIDEYIIPTEVRELVDVMFDEGHITYKQRQDIQETTITTDKMEKLVRILIKKSDEASYQCLLRHLQGSNHGDIVDTLHSQMVTVKTLSKPPEEDIIEMMHRIRTNFTNVSIGEIMDLLTLIEEQTIQASKEWKGVVVQSLPPRNDAVVHPLPPQKGAVVQPVSPTEIYPCLDTIAECGGEERTQDGRSASLVQADEDFAKDLHNRINGIDERHETNERRITRSRCYRKRERGKSSEEDMMTGDRGLGYPAQTEHTSNESEVNKRAKWMKDSRFDIDDALLALDTEISAHPWYTDNITSQDRNMRQQSSAEVNDDELRAHFNVIAQGLHQQKRTRKSLVINAVRNWVTPKTPGLMRNYLGLHNKAKPFDVNVVCHDADLIYAYDIVQTLKTYCYKVYFQYQDALPGQYITKSFEQGITSCERVLVILTRNFVTSHLYQWYFEVIHKLAIERALGVVVIIADNDVITQQQKLGTTIRRSITPQNILHNDRSFWKKLFAKLPKPQNGIKPVFRNLPVPRMIFKGLSSLAEMLESTNKHDTAIWYC